MPINSVTILRTTEHPQGLRKPRMSGKTPGMRKEQAVSCPCRPHADGEALPSGAGADKGHFLGSI